MKKSNHATLQQHQYTKSGVCVCDNEGVCVCVCVFVCEGMTLTKELYLG